MPQYWDPWPGKMKRAESRSAVLVMQPVTWHHKIADGPFYPLPKPPGVHARAVTKMVEAECLYKAPAFD